MFVNVNDTLLCHPGDLFLSLNITGNCKTYYQVNTIPFQEYLVTTIFYFITDDDVVGPFAIGFDFKFFGSNTINT